MDKQTLNTKLINHYKSFNTERFFLDDYDEKRGLVSIVTSSIQDSCPITLCRNIAKYVKKQIDKNKFPFIYVGAYAFKTDKL